MRAFLQAKGKVNRGLQKTIQEQPSRFLAYNNGLCCTAASVDVEVDENGHARLNSVRDFRDRQRRPDNRIHLPREEEGTDGRRAGRCAGQADCHQRAVEGR